MGDSKAIRAEIKAIRAEMKAKGIRRVSCFNCGHSAESYRLNARMFELETRLRGAQSSR
jgi:hypothetical protein